MKALLLLLFAGALWLAPGCNDSQARETAAPVPAAIYKPGHGIQLSPAASAFAGVATAEFTGRLPAAALLRTVKGDFVYVVNGDWLLRTPVTVVAEAGTDFTVNDGLYEGDRVAVGGVRALWLAELQAVNGGVGCADGH